MRGTDVFFYDLLMDLPRLRSRGFAPQKAGIALLNDYALEVGHRATLLPRTGAQVHGVVAWLPLDEVRALYCFDYQPEAVFVDDPDYLVRPALCFNLVAPASPGAYCAGLGERIADLGRRLGVPENNWGRSKN